MFKPCLTIDLFKLVSGKTSVTVAIEAKERYLGSLLPSPNAKKQDSVDPTTLSLQIIASAGGKISGLWW